MRLQKLMYFAVVFISLIIVMHVALVFIVHPSHNLAQMMLGVNDPERLAQALTMVLIGVAAVVAVWIFLSYWTLSDLRGSQRIIWNLSEPMGKVFLNWMDSRRGLRTRRGKRSRGPNI